MLRIGINLGDVMVEGSDLYGEGVNIAARLEGIAEPGGILVSSNAYDQVKNKIKIDFDDLGAKALKNIAEPVRAYRVTGTPTVAVLAPKPVADKTSIAVLPFNNMSNDPEQEYFSDGITEDIITELSRWRPTASPVAPCFVSVSGCRPPPETHRARTRRSLRGRGQRASNSATGSESPHN